MTERYDPGFRFVRDYLDWLTKTHSDFTVYRGHANGSWPLLPSALRPDAEGIVTPHQLGLWKEQAKRFAHPRPIGDVEWLVLAQHHGIPTILLDWTTNPLAALMFACLPIGGDERVSGKVIGIADGFSIRPITPDSDPFSSDVERPVLFDASAMNTRSIAQDSFMSVNSTLEGALTPDGMDKNEFDVPHEFKYPVTVALSTMGVSEERMYTDISAVATVFKRRLANAKRVGLENAHIYREPRYQNKKI